MLILELNFDEKKYTHKHFNLVIYIIMTIYIYKTIYDCALSIRTKNQSYFL